MNNSESTLIGIYTLTPLHMGTGQAARAIDLPVAREAHTGYPIIPATSLKGVARDICEQNGTTQASIDSIFGPDQETAEDGGQAGDVIFSEAQLLALPFRSLNLPLAYCTSMQLLERFSRNLRLFGCENFLTLETHLQSLSDGTVHVSDEKLENHLLVIEDMAFQNNEVNFSDAALAIARKLITLLPENETATRARLQNSLIILPDLEFQSLAQRALPVQARIKLTGEKGTAEITNMDGTKEKGNLWFEEYVCPDSLFACFIRKRPGSRAKKNPVTSFISSAFPDDHSFPVQMGGNETVGYGWCWWKNPQKQTTSSTQ